MGDELDRTRRRSVLDSVPGTPSTPVNNHPSQVISGASTTEGKLAANLNGGHKDSEKSSIAIWKQIFDPVVPYVQVSKF